MRYVTNLGKIDDAKIALDAASCIVKGKLPFRFPTGS